MSYVVYVSCYGEVAMTDGLCKSDALALVRYLKLHPKAAALYIVNAKQK